MDKRLDTVGQALVMVWVILLLQSLCTWLIRLLFPGEIPAYFYLFFMILVEIVTILLPALWMLRQHPHLREGLTPTALRVDLPEVLLLSGAALVGVFVLTELSGLFILLLDALHIPLLVSYMPPINTSMVFALTLVAVALVPGVSEELMFRGVLTQSLMPYGTRKAIVVSALVFALMHGSLPGLPAHVAVGFVLGILWVYTGSIQVPILYHILHNGFSTLLSLLVDGVQNGAAGTEVAALELTPGNVLTAFFVIALLGALWVFLLGAVTRRRSRRGFIPRVVRKQDALPLSPLTRGILYITLVVEVMLYITTLLPYLGGAA